MLTVTNLSKVFTLEKQWLTAIDDLSFTVSDGDFFTFIGPSGCGKSTLIRIIAGLDQPTVGTISWSVPPEIGYVFQHYALFPFLTVSENIEFGLKMKGIKPSIRHGITNQLIEEVGLQGFADKHPKELSGGMKQRVGIARSLAISPNVILLDEPFSSLDEFTADVLRNVLLQLWQKRKMTVIMITHLVTEAIELSDTIAVLSSSPGRLKKIIENPLKRPRNLRSSEFYTIEDSLLHLIKG